MKAIFVAALKNSSASGRQRLWALKACGVEVITIDKNSFEKPWLQLKIANLFKLSFLKLNNKLSKAIIKEIIINKPDLLWLEWPQEFTASNILAFKAACKDMRLVSFQDDNPWGDRFKDFWMWKYYLKITPYFDVHLVKRESDISNLKRYSKAPCYLWEGGIYSPLFRKPPHNIIIKYPIIFVGTCLDDRAKLIGYLLDNGVPIHVFGNKWHERTNLPKLYPNQFHAAVEGQSYVDVIWEATMCLGLVSHTNRDEWTMRSYEVPGCGKPLIAEKTPFHTSLFKDNSLLLFSSQEDCLEKINHFLDNQYDACKLGSLLHQSFLNDKRTLDHCMKVFLETKLSF
ncbi:glycosyltransferase [Parasediminibacterium paludis]|uniref:Glycosyltransferase n=1 Tax=Parasediminibacterium paludis TaxID=908966 RepID=A0ABV8Q042_9BACT